MKHLYKKKSFDRTKNLDKIKIIIRDYPGGKKNAKAIMKLEYIFYLMKTGNSAGGKRLATLKKLLLIYYSEKKIDSLKPKVLRTYILALCDEIKIFLAEILLLVLYSGDNIIRIRTIIRSLYYSLN